MKSRLRTCPSFWGFIAAQGDIAILRKAHTLSIRAAAVNDAVQGNYNLSSWSIPSQGQMMPLSIVDGLDVVIVRRELDKQLVKLVEQIEKDTVILSLDNNPFVDWFIPVFYGVEGKVGSCFSSLILFSFKASICISDLISIL